MVKGKKNDHGSGFKRTGKQWEQSIADHIGKIIDNSNLEQIQNFLLYGSVAILGAYVTNDIRGLIIGPLGLKLATSDNIVSGAAGLAVLAALGVATISKEAPVHTLPMWWIPIFK